MMPEVTSFFGILGATLLGLLVTQNNLTQPNQDEVECDNIIGCVPVPEGRQFTMNVNDSMNLNLCTIFGFFGLSCNTLDISALAALLGVTLITTSAIALVSAPFSAGSSPFGPGAGILLIGKYLIEAIFNFIIIIIMIIMRIKCNVLGNATEPEDCSRLGPLFCRARNGQCCEGFVDNGRFIQCSQLLSC